MIGEIEQLLLRQLISVMGPQMRVDRHKTEEKLSVNL